MLERALADAKAGATADPGPVRVLELGAGVGLAGLVMAKEGAHVTLTDNQPAALDLMKQNADANGVSDQVDVAFFDWNEEKCYKDDDSGVGISVCQRTFDFIVCSDVVYEHRDQSGLIRALCHFANKSPATKPVKVFMAYVHRTAKVDAFFDQVAASFEVQKVDKTVLDEEFRYEKIDLFVMTLH